MDDLRHVLDHLQTMPQDHAEYRMDGETFRAIVRVLREAAEWAEVPRLKLGPLTDQTQAQGYPPR